MSLSLISSMTGATGVFAARHRESFPSLPSSSPFRTSRGAAHVAGARKGLSSRSRRLEKRDKKGGSTTVNDEAPPAEVGGGGMAPMESPGGGGIEGFEYSTTPMPVLPGEEKDIWEGPQWNALGFFVQYQWAFGIVFAVIPPPAYYRHLNCTGYLLTEAMLSQLIACGIAVATYNQGATDFRQTPIYKESVQSRELLEEPEASNTDVFEANPTEVAPSLE
ncbi:hypothetical protein B296_00035191 [Ensete ventricosum]|uniref:Uncharacterized protein n=1 Tax=Ensete ventricosum TaxID=4639 RepID=A0A426YTR6_ENSVE|nr:hypothetical protein B296_00035191 [Ensete ventricosum]